jgi:predicted NAD/FAD-dependent oxidoreductase
LPSEAPATSLAVVGAGVASCVLVARLRQLGYRGTITVLESGRGPGGRTSTRRSRQDPGLRINHGAPLFNLDPIPQQGTELHLLEPLLQGGWLEPWSGVIATLGADGSLGGVADPLLARGRLLVGRGGMDQLCQGLLSLAATAGPAIDSRYGTLVRHLEVDAAGRWRLLDARGELLVLAHWLVLGGTLLAHPRALLVFGWEAIPLLQPARRLADPQLDHALAMIAGLRSVARSSLLLVCTGEAARRWLQLPFRLLAFDGAAQQRFGLWRLSIQPQSDGRAVVVAHSSTVVAEEFLGVYGSRSAAALQLGMAPPAEREQEAIARLGAAVLAALGSHGHPTMVQEADQQLMRWGAAFPEGSGLPPELCLCPHSRIGFCGDAVAGPGFGRVEGAWRSGEALAAQLLSQL